MKPSCSGFLIVYCKNLLGKTKTLLLCNDFLLECKGLKVVTVILLEVGRGKETLTHHFYIFMETALGLPPVLAARSELLSLQVNFLKV